MDKSTQTYWLEGIREAEVWIEVLIQNSRFVDQIREAVPKGIKETPARKFGDHSTLGEPKRSCLKSRLNGHQDMRLKEKVHLQDRSLQTIKSYTAQKIKDEMRHKKHQWH